MSDYLNITASLPNDDLDLIKAFKSGDKSSFDKLVLKYQNKIFNLCFRFLGDYEEANDCAQDIFFKVFKSLKKFRFESTFYTWLYRITINTCEIRLKALEHRYKKKTISLENARLQGSSNHSTEIRDNSPSPIEQLEQRERNILVQKAINSLSREHKIVIILRDIEQLPYEEIAATTGFEIGTVKSKIARARMKLRKKLERVIKNGMC